MLKPGQCPLSPVVLGTAGQTTEAASIQEYALALGRKQMRPDAPDVGASTLNLAFTLCHAGRHAKADPHYREAIRIAGTTQRQNAVSDALPGYAMGATMAGKSDLAFDCLRKSLDTGFGYVAQLDTLDDLKPSRGDPRPPVLLAEITSRSAAKPQSTRSRTAVKFSRKIRTSTGAEYDEPPQGTDLDSPREPPRVAGVRPSGLGWGWRLLRAVR